MARLCIMSGGMPESGSHSELDKWYHTYVYAWGDLVVRLTAPDLLYQFTGREMKSGENFSLLYTLADKLNAAGKDTQVQLV